jgi:RimJ/RimL family protein N-acetyltransferase
MQRGDVSAVTPWFADPETARWLGGERWPAQVLELAVPAAGRFAYIAMDGDRAVGLVDVECYRDSRASMAIVVAPDARRRGIGLAIVRLLDEHVDLVRVTEFFAGVESGNDASRCLVRAAGYVQVTSEPDEEAFTYYARRRDGSAPTSPWFRHPVVHAGNSSQ